MNIQRYIYCMALVCGGILSSTGACASTVRIDVELPKIEANPYHKPYVAIWLETTDRQPIQTLSLWVEKDTWLKDLRQWWRKIGREVDASIDGITGATRSPGKYQIQWEAQNTNGEPLKPGTYLLNIESSREEGGRSYVRERIIIGKKNTIHVPSSKELGEIYITTE